MFRKVIALLGLFLISATASAQVININGAITGGSGALAGLAPPGTPFAGSLNWGGATLDGGQVTLGGFCFTDDASGLPPASPTCGALSAVPLLTTGQAVYNGTPAAPGSTFQQAGTTFNGVTGVLRLIAYSPTFVVNINIDLTFNGDGTGTVLADAGALGTATGTFTYPVALPPNASGPAIPVMPVYGLVLTGVGLVFVARRRLRKLLKPR